MSEPEPLEDDDEEPAPPAGRSFPILAVAGAVAGAILVAAAIYIGLQLRSANQAQADREAEDAAPRPSRPACLALRADGCDPAHQLPVALDPWLAGLGLTMPDDNVTVDGADHVTVVLADANAGARLSVVHARQVVYEIRCEVNSTGTTPMTAEDLAFLARCGRAALPAADTSVDAAVQWLSANVHPAPGGLTERFQCGGVAFSLQIKPLQSALDITVPADRTYCGTW
ncbi:hypothetical protein [Dactylosporangium sp. CA-139066]|uniref:hypothetical protein n=1 Tax=Dactylosporangium sp. CA-139066 TaxID=3239930 RepID=UPI003D904526